MKKMLVPLFAMLILLLSPHMASAKSLFEHQNTIVPEGQTVDDVYVVGGDANIQGHVKGIVVVVNGHLQLAGTAQVEGLIVVIGGEVKQESGAVLGDDLYNFSLDSATQNSLLLGGGLVLGLWILQLAGSLLLVLIPVLICVLGRQKAAAFMKRYGSEPLGKLLNQGFWSGLILAALSVLLLVTIIGIPLLVLVLLVLIVALFIGVTVLSARIGEWLPLNERRADWFKVLTGAALITAFANIPVLGWMVLGVVILLSLGVCTQWLMGKVRRGQSK